MGLADVERLAVAIVNRRLALTGVQRKLSLSVSGSGADRRLTSVGALGGPHILKPPAPEYPGMPGDDALRLFELTVFSFPVGNSDMHFKNWTLVRDAGRVALSPAYDLLPVRLLVDDPEEFALPINGRKNRLERRDFEALGQHLKIPDVVIRRTLAELPARLNQAIEQHPSPWVTARQARAFQSLVARNTARLGPGRPPRKTPRASLVKKPAKRRPRTRR